MIRWLLRADPEQVLALPERLIDRMQSVLAAFLREPEVIGFSLRR